MKKRLRIKRLNEADLGQTSGDIERIIAKLEGANITGADGMIKNISTPDEFRDLMRHIANASGASNADLGPWMMAVAQEFQKGQHTPATDGIQETVKVTVSGLKALIREELEREEVSAEDLVLLVMDAPADEKEAQSLAVKTVMDPSDKANSFFVDKGKIYFFASADDLRSWQQMTKEDRMDKPAPESRQEPGDPYMSREEFREKAKKHNWTYEYSSGNTYYKGKDAAAILRRAYEDFKARGWEPPTWQEIRLWSYGNIIEDLQQDEEGNLYHSGSPQRPAYKLSKDSTISREDWNKIDQWFSK